MRPFLLRLFLQHFLISPPDVRVFDHFAKGFFPPLEPRQGKVGRLDVGSCRRLCSCFATKAQQQQRRCLARVKYALTWHAQFSYVFSCGSSHHAFYIIAKHHLVNVPWGSFFLSCFHLGVPFKVFHILLYPTINQTKWALHRDHSLWHP